ncbi:Transcriptional regulator, ArsR family [Fulvivirga imtechensis AK7]|uniref:Transcriptional regulator, ArsR family n=1 Tax=Fulvivirga imtechensis AK7 TaxID=1237149 RepID=L8JTJ1_9BACT|nr:winged helix-turn-helix domain-containing protein [Fulvivirga imtechensis]ELR70647.1 Transcriptional regulator, ArsR family [Fulvivirga imtechensis AK7]
MKEQIGELFSLIGDQVRSNILWTLLDGKAYTASELAFNADTSPQNISMHLNKLLQADLVQVERQGRHRYYRYSKPEVAYAVEAVVNLVPQKNNKAISGSHDDPIRHCRTCYDHLAGKVGVLITDSLIKKEFIVPVDNTFDVTFQGERFFLDLGIKINELKNKKRAFARPCLDWSERKHHLAGALGAALLNRMLEQDWIRKKQNTRAILITSKGQHLMYHYFKISV